MVLQSMILGSATLFVVLAGVGLVLFVAFLPVVIGLVCWWKSADNTTGKVVAVVAVQAVHVRLLWLSAGYLAAVRRLVYPIRMLLMPVVVWIIRLETSIREEEPTLYFDASKIRSSHTKELPFDESTKAVVRSLRRSVRRRYRKMEMIFRQARIRHTSVWSDERLCLADVVPIMLEHERRSCQTDGKNFVVEFVKRFLVVVMYPYAVLDLYYDTDDRLCGFQLSVQQGSILHWQMYFCLSRASRSGIWFHGILTNLVRGTQNSAIRYVNGHVHQEDSKRNAGFVTASEHSCDKMILRELYPFRFMTSPPASFFAVELWTGKT